jgi:hypothetical protein
MGKSYPPCFTQLKAKAQIKGWENGHHTLTISREGLVELLRPFLKKIDFDEAWYLETYPDVAEGLVNQQISSGLDHYLNFGYFENRLPNGTDFDPVHYANSNLDVLEVFGREKPESLVQHFIENGYAEGRSAAE